MAQNKKYLRRKTFGDGPGVYVTNELRNSTAYKLLTPNEKLVLIDMIRRYYLKSGGDKTSLKGTGFTYIFADCMEGVDSKTFHCARRRLCEVGFFARTDNLKLIMPASPDVFEESIQWKSYVPSEMESTKLSRREGRKTALIERNKARRRGFFQRREGNNSE